MIAGPAPMRSKAIVVPSAEVTLFSTSMTVLLRKVAVAATDWGAAPTASRHRVARS
jgi:hypothetical protein